MVEIKDIGNHGRLVELGGNRKPQGTGGFQDYVKQCVEEADQLQKEADQAVSDLSTGKLENMHQAVIAMEKAEVSFKLMVEARNRIVRAYEEIMKLQA